MVALFKAFLSISSTLRASSACIFPLINIEDDDAEALAAAPPPFFASEVNRLQMLILGST